MDVNYSGLVWKLIAAMAAITAASFIVCDLAVEPFSNPSLLGMLGGVLIAKEIFRRVRPDRRLHDLIEGAAQIVLILLFGILLTYAAMTTEFPYRDSELYALDQIIGFDRGAYSRFFDRYPLLDDMIGISYLSFLPQFAFVPMILHVRAQGARAQRFLLATGLALLLTVTISVFVPAVDAYVYVDITPAVFSKISGTIYTQVPTLEALRAGTLDMIALDDLEGLITFPSFHTAGGLLFIWALWPLRYLRWPALALNTALIAATPTDGAHYFVDLIGGAIVAGLSIAGSWLLCRYGASRSRAANPAQGPSAFADA